MFEKVIDKKAMDLIDRLSTLSLSAGWYLGGGTGLSLQIGHRKSFDLDFFTREKFKGEIVANEISRLVDFNVEILKKDTLIGAAGKVKFGLFYYPYPLIEDLKLWKKIYLASIKDIAAMKIVAVSQRGTKRDFIDLYFVCQSGYSLKDVLKFYESKYGKLKQNFYAILKSLVYFEDADKEEMPVMLKEVKWRDVKNFFIEEIKKVKYEFN